jgi:hypothetical protein
MLILSVTFIFMVWLAAKIYRVGILMYGKKPTYKDLYKWLKAIHSGAIVSTDGLNTLSESAGSQAYLGNVNWKNGSIIEHHHHGSSGNFEATVRYYKDKELYIVILTNQKNGNVSKIADKLIDLVEQTTSAEIGN